MGPVALKDTDKDVEFREGTRNASWFFNVSEAQGEESTMKHLRHRKLVVITALATLAGAGSAEAVIINYFPVFGIVMGMQAARINAVLGGYGNPEELPCPVTLTFIDSQGNAYGDPDQFQLRGGVAVHTDFYGDPNQRNATRLAIRAQVAYGNPNQFPGCAGGVLTSVEVIDHSTKQTHLILTNPEQVVGTQPQ